MGEIRVAPKEKRKRLSSGERRQEFIAKAIELFAEEGFENSTRELARRLGVTQPLLYRYFPSKDDLIAEVYNVVYVSRWQDRWSDLIADRSQPLRQRLEAFYDAYTEVIFERDWMRIYLFSGLKGVDINRRYMKLVRERILEPIIRECRHAAGLPDRPASEEEVEHAWLMHGGIFYYGVRTQVYEGVEPTMKHFVIRTALDAFFFEIEKVSQAADRSP
ncbi:MAG: TetR/AcrR family transcriptional regulator [Pseudomonadota bacterium]